MASGEAVSSIQASPNAQNSDGELSFSSGPQIDCPPSSLGAILSNAAQTHPKRDALLWLDRDQPGHVHRWTYRKLEDEAKRLASYLQKQGIGIGDPVVALVPNCTEFVVMLWAAALLGAPFVPLDPQSIEHVETMEHYLTSTKPLVVLVDDGAEAFENRDEWKDGSRNLKVKLCIQRSIPGWKLFQEAITTGSDSLEGLQLPHVNAESDVALIIFTSGTTALPKACPITGSILSASSYQNEISFQLTSEGSVLQHLPCNSIFGMYVMTVFWYVGGAIVIPSPKFEPGASLEALNQNLCTNMWLVPSMYDAMVGHPDYDVGKFKGVLDIGVGGALVPTTFVRKACKAFNAKHVLPGLGMTEAIPICRWNVTDPPAPEADFVSVGRVIHGNTIKVCEPESVHPVARGIAAELHVSGATLIKKYLNAESDNFYSDAEGRHWFKTGDQVVMNQDETITVLGRYKDIIIRGGQNISPARIEASLNKVKGVTAQVVGIPDDLTGEAPVAIIQYKPGSEVVSSSVLQKQVRQDLGTSHILSRIFTLVELGLEAFPITVSTGKVRKIELREAVQNHFRNKSRERSVDEASANEGSADEGSAGDVQTSTLQSLVLLWSEVLGIARDDVPLDVPAEKLADSLTLSRMRVLIKRKFGKDIAEAKLNSTDGIRSQAKIIDAQSQQETPPTQSRNRYDGSPSIEDIPHLHNSEEAFGEIQGLVQTAFTGTDLSWSSDVEAIYPAVHNPLRYLRRRRNLTFNIRTAMISRNTTLAHVRSTISKVAENWEVTRTFVIWQSEEKALYVQLRNESWLRHGLSEHIHEVSDKSALRQLARRDADEFIVQPPGPMFRVLLSQIANSSDVGIIVMAHHCTFDAISMRMWLDDLRNTINDDTYELPERVPYKIFADLSHNGATSDQALTSVGFFEKYLEGVSDLKVSKWLAQRRQTPGDTARHIGCHRGTSSPGTYLDDDNGEGGLDGISITASLPFLHRLTRTHGVHAAMLLKTSLALFLVREDDIDHAMISNVLAGRQWPFLDTFVTDKLPSAMEVAGPTLASVLDIVAVRDGETAVDLLQRITKEQELLTRHGLAPRSVIAKRLKPKDASVVTEMMVRNAFNWLPQEQKLDAQSETAVEVLQRDQYWDVGIIWNCQLLSPVDNVPTVSIRAHYDGVQISQKEMQAAADHVGRIAQWLHSPENWERSVKDSCRETAEAS